MKQPGSRAPDDSPAASNRRRTIRLDAPSGLTVTLSDAGVKARVVDISLGGLGLVCSAALKKDSTYTLKLHMGTEVVTCGAKAAHCRRMDSGYWMVGMAFVKDDRLALVERLIDSITGSMIEFS